MAAKIVLYSEKDAKGTHREFMADDPNLLITGQFKSAVVDKGQWIVYSSFYYNPFSYCCGADNVQVLTEGPSGAINLKFVPESIRRVETFGSEGVTIYKHNNYCGTQQLIGESTSLIHVGGASSLIISGGLWTLFTQADYNGMESTKYPGSYPTSAAMDFPNDTLGSIRKAQ